MVQSPIQILSLADFLQQPETKPAREYIDGQIIHKPMPKGEHSAIQTELATTINVSLKRPKIARAFSELRCTFGGQSIIPDISVFQWERIPRQDSGRVENEFRISPDWVIEILSPGQSQTPVIRKIIHCLDHGTQMGWLIDPSEQAVFAYHLDKSTTFHAQDNEVLPTPDFASDLELKVIELFGWLLD